MEKKKLHHRPITLTESDVKRFKSKTEEATDGSGCLLWKGGVFSSGYALFVLNGEPFRASRVAFQIEHGDIPDGKIVLHSCDNKICVAVAHLRLGTNKDNTHDMISKNRHTFFGGPSGPRKRGCWNPETVTKGDDHWTRKNPEKLLRGDKHPRFGRHVGEAVGETHHLAKANEDKVREIRRKYDAKEASQNQLAEQYGMSQASINSIVLRKTWKHVI